MTPNEKIEKYIEEEKSSRREPFSQMWNPPDSEAFGRLIRRSILKGLELARGAGPHLPPTMFPAVFDMQQDKWMKAGAEAALTAKNSAIDDLINSLKD